MTPLEKIRTWLQTFEDFDILNHFRVDFTDQVPANGGIFPSGLVEVDRRQDIFGSVTVTNQYNFGLNYVFEKAPGDDAGATINADWVMDFQEWVQQQSIRRKVPVFGDEPQRETVKAQNGTNSYADIDGVGVYTVHLSINFIKKYEVN